jgi:acyl carrier protein
MAKKDSDILGVSRLDKQPAGDLQEQASPPPGSTAPVTATEIKIAAIWQAVLPGVPVYRESNFIAIGGDSLSLAQVITEVEAEFKVVLTVEIVATNLVLKDMADAIDKLVGKDKPG